MHPFPVIWGRVGATVPTALIQKTYKRTAIGGGVLGDATVTLRGQNRNLQWGIWYHARNEHDGKETYIRKV